MLSGERVAAGMTYDDLAGVSGISKRALMRYLSTKDRHIDVHVLDTLAGVFRTTPVHIMAAATERLNRPEVADEAAYASFRASEGLGAALDEHIAGQSVEKVKTPSKRA